MYHASILLGCSQMKPKSAVSYPFVFTLRVEKYIFEFLLESLRNILQEKILCERGRTAIDI